MNIPLLARIHHGSPAQAVGVVLACLFVAAPARAQLRDTPNLASILFVERSANTFYHDYSLTSTELTTRLADLDATSDFVGTVEEHYDVFFSDADGAFDLDGNYVTVEAAFQPVGGGLNISAVKLVFNDLSEQCACRVMSAVYLGSSAVPGSAAKAANCDEGDWSTMGNTAPSERLRITLDFACSPDPMKTICFPDTAGVRSCPCGNPPVPNDGTRGCNNFGPTPAGGTGGARFSATGDAVASSATSLVFHVTDMQTPCSLVVFFGGTQLLTSGVASGGGVRCVSSLITPRMYKSVTTFNSGAIDFPSADVNPNVDPWTRSNAPAAGSTRYYYAAYRNGQAGNHPPCTAQSAFNLTNAGAVIWHL